MKTIFSKDGACALSAKSAKILKQKKLFCDLLISLLRFKTQASERASFDIIFDKQLHCLMLSYDFYLQQNNFKRAYVVYLDQL